MSDETKPAAPDVAAATDEPCISCSRITEDPGHVFCCIRCPPGALVTEHSRACDALQERATLIARIDELRAELEVVRKHYKELETQNFDLTHANERRETRITELEAYCRRLIDEHDEVDRNVSVALGEALTGISGVHPGTCERVWAAIAPLFADNRFRRERIAELEALLAARESSAKVREEQFAELQAIADRADELEAVTGPMLGCCGRYAVEHSSVQALRAAIGLDTRLPPRYTRRS